MFGKGGGSLYTPVLVMLGWDVGVCHLHGPLPEPRHGAGRHHRLRAQPPGRLQVLRGVPPGHDRRAPFWARC
ncbi:MAG: hypothetical protein MZW92_29310 [Comamonadaceae bacterium]|nr:hypothetical protein [Comamonadaceae bacterium]